MTGERGEVHTSKLFKTFTHLILNGDLAELLTNLSLHITYGYPIANPFHGYGYCDGNGAFC